MPALLREPAERFPVDAIYASRYKDFERPCKYSQASFIMSHLAKRIRDSSLYNGFSEAQLREYVTDEVRAMPLVTGCRFTLALMYFFWAVIILNGKQIKS